MTTSIVILTHNQLALTHKCLESIREHTKDYEIIIVDNGSTDETVQYLQLQKDVIFKLNGENLGFAKGCNQGTELSSGENILFLNNDTIVTEHWLDNMLRVLYENERVGMVGPVTNYSSGHQKIPVPYTSLNDLDSFAKLHCEENAGCYTDVRRLVGFCLLAKRSVLDEIGHFDEVFGLGNYEDDDLSLRALRAGYLLRVVNDSFIHHIGHATMSILPDDSLAGLLVKNRQRAIEKWGRDIHQLIYKPEISVSICIVTMNAEPTISDVLETIQDDVAEIIIVDLGSEDRTAEIASNYGARVYQLAEQEEGIDPYRFAFEQATNQYVIWLEQDEVLSSELIRKLSGLKFSLEGTEDVADLTTNNIEAAHSTKQQSMYRRAAGFRTPDNLGKDVDELITISLCLIVKNEEDALPKCLSSVKGIADEIIIIDTGSTDRTKEVAAQFNSKIYDFEWIDNFGAARNFAFSKATKKYIFWLDADDFLQEKDRQILIKLKKNLTLDVDSVTMHYYLGFDEAGNVTSSLRRNRIVRRDCNFQWIGPVHEYLAVYGNIQNSEAGVTHSKNKTYTDRNLQIYLRREQEGEEFTPRDLYYFANELRDHSQFRKAILYYDLFLEGKKGWIEDNIQACLKIADCYTKLENKDKMIESLCRTLVYDKPRADFCCSMGSYFLDETQYETAIYWYSAAVDYKPSGTNLGIVNQTTTTWLPHLMLCLCYDRLGQFEKANEHNEIALSYHPTHSSMLFNKEYFTNKFASQ